MVAPKKTTCTVPVARPGIILWGLGVMGVGSWEGCRLKFYIQVRIFWCILTAIKSLELQLMTACFRPGGYQKIIVGFAQIPLVVSG